MPGGVGGVMLEFSCFPGAQMFLTSSDQEKTLSWRATAISSGQRNGHIPSEERTSLRLLLSGDKITVPRDVLRNQLWIQHS